MENLKPKNVVIGFILALGVLAVLYFTFGLPSNDDGEASPAPTDVSLAPIPQETAERPKQESIAPTVSPTPSPSAKPGINDKEELLGGNGMELTDPDSLEAARVGREFAEIYRGSSSAKYENSNSYLDVLLEKNLITNGFYDSRKVEYPTPSKTKTSGATFTLKKDVDCPLVSQTGPVFVGGKGRLSCFVQGGFKIDNYYITRDQASEMQIGFIDPNSDHKVDLEFVQEGSDWKVSGIG